jgi:hypothetical protein
MAIQQAGSSYRDPMKAMTIKALQARQAAAAAATAKSMEVPAQIASPWQGVSHLAGILGSEYSQNKVDSAESDARNRLAALKAQINPETGATSQQLADIGQLDQEFADKEFARIAAAREAAKLETQREAHDTSERIGGQQFTSGQTQAGFTEQEKQAATQVKANQDAAAAQVKADQDAAAQSARTAADVATVADTRTQAQKEQEAALSPDMVKLDLALKAGRMTPEDYQQQKQLLIQKQQAQAAAAGPDIWNDMTPDQRTYYHVPADAPAQINSKTKEIKIGQVPTTPQQADMNQKITSDVQDWDNKGRVNVENAIDKVEKSMAAIAPGQSSGGKVAETLGVGQTGPVAGLLSKLPIVGPYTQSFFNSDMLAAQKDMQTAVQSTLKETLGSQFTQQEGEGLMSRAFDINLGPDKNMENARDIMLKLKKAQYLKADQSKYWHEHGGDMSKYVPPEGGIEALKQEVANMFRDGGGGANAPAGGGGGGAGGWKVEEAN